MLASFAVELLDAIHTLVWRFFVAFLKNALLQVCPKRTNRPGMSTTDRLPRGRTGRRGERVIVQYVYAGDLRNNGVFPAKYVTKFLKNVISVS